MFTPEPKPLQSGWVSEWLMASEEDRTMLRKCKGWWLEASQGGRVSLLSLFNMFAVWTLACTRGQWHLQALREEEEACVISFNYRGSRGPGPLGTRPREGQSRVG